MEINKLSNQLDRRLHEDGRVRKSGETGKTDGPRERSGETAPTDDRVSVHHLEEIESDEALARTELDKLDRDRFEKLQELKSKLQEFQEAKRDLTERILETELGQKVEDPTVMQQVAQQMIDPASRL